ncbi:fibronectin type III domain-containing protein [Chryseobacterium camelliae]|uniref:Fibronectin type III domain-containing protein n=1 Tax=Chryseobacterium camelliae TaxID=1265445 RepID=A0ABY7QL11_9FLAO|nr:fibronectin type III domain-containing protein [Chryseobacterium camelliae]WBV60376.1 fibronectin type III domain-containing protein [Chryseobacterium camelliae]
MKKLLLMCMCVLGIAVAAQTNVANYAFSKSTGNTYTPITGGTKLFPTGTNTAYDNEVSAAITLSSPFTFGGVTMTTCYVSANGYITFGAAPTGTNYTPLSTLGSTTGAISAFGQDGGFSSADTTQPPGNHEVRYEDLGTEFVVQWQDHANYHNRSTERLNFQIRLVYATGQINIIYGTCTDPGTTSTTGTTSQVGIRGNSATYATNVNSLMIGNIPAGTTCDWSKAVTGNANNSSLLFSGTTNVNVKIPAGLQYSWTPGTQLPVRTFAATSAVTNNGATLSWTAPTGATSYNVQYRIIGNCDWTNFSGNPVSATTASLIGLDQNTTYQVQVQALNGAAQSIYSHIPNLAGTGNGYVAAGSFTTVANCASTVTGLTSSAVTPNTATISWTASTAPPANGYEYYYNTSSATPANNVTPSGSTAAGVITANLSGLAPSTQYYYWVRANCNGTDKGVWSSSANFTTLGLCPTVTAPAANATGQSLTPTITWTAITGVTGYKLRVGTTSGGTDILNDVDLGNVSTYTFSSALNYLTTYYYSVTGYTAATPAPATPCTIRSFTTIASCVEPTALTVTNAAITGGGVSWTAPSTAPAAGYEIYYSTSNTAPTSSTVLTPANSTTSTTTSASISGLSPSTIYYVWVRSACVGTDRSVWTGSVSFLTLCQPPMLSTTGATVCPGTTATLSATTDAGATINWYSASTGGTVLATGNSYTTPALTTTTDYWVTAATGVTGYAGLANAVSTSGYTLEAGLFFNALAGFTLDGVYVYPTGTGAGTVTIALQDGSVSPAVTLQSITVNLTGSTTPTKTFVPLNFIVAPGTNYKLMMMTRTGNVTGLIRESGSSWGAYPLTLPGIVSITNGNCCSANATSASYYYFYDWKVRTGCESARQMVTATVSSAGCLGTSEVSSKEEVKVYPNPFVDVLNISDVNNVKSISVMDISGRLVKAFDEPNSILHLGDLNSGMYLVVLNMKDGSKQTIKAIKK